MAGLRLNKAALFKRVNYTPHSGQEPVHRSTARNRVVAGGRRFGKSQIGGHELTPEVFRAYSAAEQLREAGNRREFWIVGPEYSDSEKEFRVLWNDLRRLRVPMDRPGSYNDPVNGNLHISCWDGIFQVHAKSARHPETLVGEGLSGVIMAEAAKLKQSVWEKSIRPTLADFKGWSLFSSTPEGKNWFYDLWQTGNDPAVTEWESWRRPAWLNPWVYPGGVNDPEILALRRDLSNEQVFNQEIGADFSDFVGQVFKDFDEEVHVRNLTYNPAWRTYAAVDYGFTNPFVWLLIQVDEWDNVYVLGEVYDSGMDIPEAAAAIRAANLAPRDVLEFFPDPASPGDTRQLSSLLRIPATRRATGGELKDRLDLIRSSLKWQNPHLDWGHPDRRPGLYIDRRCVRTIRDFNEYRYPDAPRRNVNATEAPLKKDDHAPEALGRFFRGYFGRPTRRGNGSRVRESALSRKAA